MKLLRITKCAECGHNVSAAILALKINKPELMKGRACNAAENFIGNVNIIQAFCPLEDVDESGNVIEKASKSLKINKKIE